jgi:glycerol-3-phosphate O-acyltransferase/dihydroxyacetone phosphate acyltransferase
MIGKIINPHGFRPGYCCVWWMCRIMIWFNFRNVELIGKHRIPKEGPLLVCGSHSNQFIDAAVLISEFPRELYFLVAAVSLNHKYLKYFLKFLNVIATTRPQDLAKRGTGTILSLEENIMKGEGTKFTKELEAKFSIH